MPLPSFLRAVNRRATNRVTGMFAGRIPPFAVVTHVGRRSGRRYRTPLMAFPLGDGFLIALTYGADTDWVRNVRAQGGAALTYRGHTEVLTDPELLRRSSGELPLPRLVKAILRVSGVEEFLLLHRLRPQARTAIGAPTRPDTWDARPATADRAHLSRRSVTSGPP
ncbi:MAG TPA: nitroreductase family deazaflavin-dependent oxidoreductase [Thermomicrobiales bacterium]|jgi:deazaflavin-dependent oxidoreductase (nitroreductase family)